VATAFGQRPSVINWLSQSGLQFEDTWVGTRTAREALNALFNLATLTSGKKEIHGQDLQNHRFSAHRRVRPLDSDGSLIFLVCSTYGLSLYQSNFFYQDFLPTALGLGGVRDRGCHPGSAGAKTEGGLLPSATRNALAEGGRLTLHIDLLPIGHRTNHAKIILIHRKKVNPSRDLLCQPHELPTTARGCGDPRF
jgi:hypothetical protein